MAVFINEKRNVLQSKTAKTGLTDRYGPPTSRGLLQHHSQPPHDAIRCTSANADNKSLTRLTHNSEIISNFVVEKSDENGTHQYPD